MQTNHRKTEFQNHKSHQTTHTSNHTYSVTNTHKQVPRNLKSKQTKLQGKTQIT